MKLTVKNFGPIRKATVDVKPMTVFVGPSNTGKSYMAILIYTIAKVFERGRVQKECYIHLQRFMKNFTKRKKSINYL